MNYKYNRISRKKKWQGDLTETTCIGAYERLGPIYLWARAVYTVPQW